MNLRVRRVTGCSLSAILADYSLSADCWDLLNSAVRCTWMKSLKLQSALIVLRSDDIEPLVRAESSSKIDYPFADDLANIQP